MTPGEQELRTVLANAWWNGTKYTGERSGHAMKQACDSFIRLAQKALMVEKAQKEQMMEKPAADPGLMDLPPAEHGVEVSHDGQMLRINVDGICRLRVRVAPDKLALEVTEATAKANRDEVLPYHPEAGNQGYRE